MVRTSGELNRRTQGASDLDRDKDLIDRTIQYLDAHKGKTNLQYPTREEVSPVVLEKLQAHYSPYGWQVTQARSQLLFRFFDREEMGTLSGDLERHLDAALDSSGFKQYGPEVSVPLPSDVEPLVLSVTLNKYRQADRYLTIGTKHIPGRGIVATFKHDSARLVGDFNDK